MGEIIGFFSAAGGVGKTTISMLLGYFLKREGKRVLMIDMDPSVCLSLYILGEERVVDLMHKGKTISHLMERTREGDFRQEEFVTEGMIGEVYLDVIISDSRLSEVVDNIWYGPWAKKELFLSKALRNSKLVDNYDFIILDTIPFYDRKYTILTVYASDKYVIPLRPTIIDTYRTKNMLAELPAIASVESKALNEKSYLLFNMVKAKSKQVDEIGVYRRLFLESFPGIHVFENYLKNLVSFSRFGTKEEIGDDRKDVEKNFLPVYEEFKGFLKVQ